MAASATARSGDDVRRLPERLTKLTDPAVVRFVVLLVLCGVFAYLSPFFLRPANLVNVAVNVSVAGIIAAPLTLLLIARQVDLSVGSAVALVGVVLGLFAPTMGLPLALLLAVLAGMAVSLVNAVFVTRLGVNSLITTLATLAAVRGLAKVFADGQTLRIEGFRWLGNHRFEVLGLEVPVPVIVLVLVISVFGFILQSTVFGRQLYAIGANPRAARLAGINVRRRVFTAFILAGVCTSLAGLILASQVGAALPVSGQGLELLVITGVILGGASLNGGRGTISGTMMAIVILGVLDNGLTLLRIPSFWQEVARGALLLAAVSFDRVRVKQDNADAIF